jgi:hypothetical protein
VPTTINRPISNPYDDIHQPILTREYLLDTFPWGITPIVANYAFPDYIITNAARWPLVLPLLKMFRYWAADIEIRIKMETTPFHQGALLVSSMPGGQAALPSLTTASGLNAYVLCASEQNECKFIIPYLAPRDWIDALEPTIGPPGSDSTIGQLWIKTLNTLIPTMSNMPASVPVLIYWRFVNIKQKSPASGITVVPFDIVVDGHMKPGHNAEAAAKAKSGIDTSSVISSASSMLKEVPVIGSIYSSAVSVLKSIAPDLSKPTDQQASTNLNVPYGGQMSTVAGLDYSSELSMFPNAQVTQSPTFYGMQSSHIEVSQLAQRPMLHNTVTLTNASPMYFTYCTPLYNQGGLGATTSDWLYNMAYAFRFWRGSIKFLLHFCVPSFYAFRVQLALEDQNALPIAQEGDIINKIVDIKGNTIVTLDVPFMRTTPWVSPRQDASNLVLGVGYIPPILRVTIISQIVGSSAPTTPVVYLNIWRAGGEDTQFSSLMGARDGSDTIIVDGHMDMNTCFKKPFEPLLPSQVQSMEKGLIMPEVATTVSDCIKRLSDHLPTLVHFGAYSTYPGWFDFGTGNANAATIGREPYHYFSNMFLFWRGSRILKHFQLATPITLQGADANQSFGDGQAFFSYSPTPNYLLHNESVNVPWYAQIPYFPTQLGSQLLPSNYIQTAAGTLQPTDLFALAAVPFAICGGDDLMLLYPVPFFPLVYYPPVTSVRTTPSGPKPDSKALIVAPNNTSLTLAMKNSSFNKRASPRV